MKALAVDCAASKITISAKNDDNKATLILDIGPKQSQELLPAIDFVLSKASLKPCDLDYITICKGPGTFTGLRLAFSAVKAISLAFGTDIYAIPTLDCYAYALKDIKAQVVATIDAKKEQFFATVYKDGNKVMDSKDTSIEEVIAHLDKNYPVICTGPDCKLFAAQLKDKCPSLTISTLVSDCVSSDCLYEMAEDMIAKKIEPLKDFEGPEYLRKSEAELALENK